MSFPYERLSRKHPRYKKSYFLYFLYFFIIIIIKEVFILGHVRIKLANNFSGFWLILFPISSSVSVAILRKFCVPSYI